MSQSMTSELASRLLTLYHGRTSAYAVKNGSGYCKQDLPLTTEVVQRHLDGDETIGVYQFEPGGNAIRFAVFDIDDHSGSAGWAAVQSVAKQLRDELRQQDCEPFPVRSTGGRGIHLALFWQELHSAAAVRRFMEQIKDSCELNSGVEVEIFPKQDSVANDGYGNLVALPFALDSLPLDLNSLDTLPVSAASATLASVKPCPRVSDNRISAGQRNSTLTSLAGTLRAKGYDIDEILDQLRRDNESRCDPRLPDTEIQKIANSIGKKPVGSRKYRHTEGGNAERFVDRHGDDLCYVYRWRSWLYWGSSLWIKDDGDVVLRRMKETILSIYHEASNCSDNDTREKLGKLAGRSDRHLAMVNTIKLACSDMRVVMKADQFDANPWLLGVENGVINLTTGKAIEPRRDQLLTQQASCLFDVSASYPRWLKFLDEIFDGDEDLIGYIQRTLGYSLTGDTGEQCLFFLYGVGANGKSTLLRVIQKLLGDYARQVNPETLMVARREAGAASGDIAKLRAARFVATSETEDGKRLAEQLIKQVTGGDTITARFLYQEFFEFEPQFKIWLAANHKPVIYGTDYAIWRRIKLIPFMVTIPEAKRDPELVGKLIEELPGILNWMIDGCLEWQQGGLCEPQIVTNSTTAYRQEMDVIQAWLDNNCIVAKDKCVRSQSAYDNYREWSISNGEKPLNQRRFKVKLTEKGFEYKRGRDQRKYVGLGLLLDPTAEI